MLKRILPVLILALAVLLTGTAIAYTGDTTGTAGELYDVVVNQLLNGPVGFVGGVAALIFGTACLVMGRITPAILSLVGGAILIKAPDIATSLGMIF